MQASTLPATRTMAACVGCCLLAATASADQFFLATETNSVSTPSLRTHILCRDGEDYSLMTESEVLGDLNPFSCGVDSASNAYVFAKRFDVEGEENFFFLNGSPFSVDSFCDSPGGVTVTDADEVIVACEVPGGGEVWVDPGQPELLFAIEMENLDFEGLSARSARKIDSIVEDGEGTEMVYENSQVLAATDAELELDSIDRFSVESSGTVVVGGEWFGESFGEENVRNVLVEAGRLAAVLDWDDLSRGDRATDLAAVWTLPDTREARERAVQAYGPASSATWHRARGWAVLLGVTLLDTGLGRDPQQAAAGERTLTRLVSGP